MGMPVLSCADRLAAHHGNADDDGMERKSQRQISDDFDHDRDQIVGDAADRNRRTATIGATLQRDAIDTPPSPGRSRTG